MKKQKEFYLQRIIVRVKTFSYHFTGNKNMTVQSTLVMMEDAGQ